MEHARHSNGKKNPYLYRVVMYIKAEGDTLVEGRHRFSGHIHVTGLFRLYIAFLMVYCSFNNTIPDGLIIHTETCELQ